MQTTFEQCVGYLARIAVVGPEAHINKFGENVAFNRGLVMLVVSSEAAALEWLLP